MSLSPAVIDALVASGVTVEQLAAAMKADMAEAQARLQDKRAKDAERQRKSRMSRRVTVTPCDDVRPPNDIYSNPHDFPTEPSGSVAPRGQRDRGTKISEDWEAPSIAELSTEARKLASQWPSAAYRAEAEGFRNYWLAEAGAKARKSNWNRAWGNRIVAVHSRVMRAAQFGNGPTDKPDRPAKPMDAKEIAAAIRFNTEHEKGNPALVPELRRQLSEMGGMDPNVAHLVRRSASHMTERHRAGAA